MLPNFLEGKTDLERVREWREVLNRRLAVPLRRGIEFYRDAMVRIA